MNDFEKLIPTNEIPVEKAAAFLVVLKEASIEGELEREQDFDKLAVHLTKEEMRDTIHGGLKSGIRSTVSGNIAHVSRANRTRRERLGKGLGTGAGALAGLLATRGRSPGMKALAAGVGAVLGRGAGKEVGRELDVRKIQKGLRPEKRAEMEKHTAGTKVATVRELWKIAQGGELLSPGQAGAAASPEPAEFEELPAKSRAQQAAPRQGGGQPAITPEDLERANAMEQLALEQQADEVGQINEAEHYRQVAEEASTAAGEMQEQLQQTQGQAEQATQQAQTAQMQADQATAQATQQAQVDAQEKQQLSTQMIGAQNLNMQMRQAVTAYRENLQQLALQDPTAEADAAQQMQQPMPGSPEEQQMMAQQGQPGAEGMPPGAEQMPASAEQMPPGVVPEMLAEGEPAPAPKSKPKKEGKKDKGSGGVTVNVEKTSAISDRAFGAVLGGLGGAGLQAATDRGKAGGPSAKERWLQMKVEAMENKPKKGALDKHMINITRAMAGAAKINREHPGAAAATAGVTGALVGGTVGPNVGKMLRGLRR